MPPTALPLARVLIIALATGAALTAIPVCAASVEAYGPEPEVALSPAESEAVATARARLAGGGARPQLSGALVLAARLLARQAVAGSDPDRHPGPRNALARALAYDPAPAIYTARAPTDEWRIALERALGSGPATHVGAGVAEAGGERVVVVLASRRGAHLDPFPRSVTVGERTTLSGQLRTGLCRPRVFVALPSGQVRSLPTRGGVWFRADVSFEAPGRYVVEVLADGPQGPTVAALLPVGVGGATFDAPATVAASTEPADPGRAEAAVLDALTATRARQGLSPLAVDAALTALARKHSEAMREAGIVAHVLREEPGPTERLVRARIRFHRLFENVAAATTSLEAHAAAEESPAHLANMLQPDARRVGIGVARDARLGRVYLTELLVQ